MNETAKEIIDAIKIIVDSEIKKGTNIYSGIVDALNSDDTCIVRMSGKQYKVRYIGGVPTVGSNQKIFVPQNNMAQAFIMNPSQASSRAISAVDTVNGKTGDVVLTASDVGALPKTGFNISNKSSGIVSTWDDKITWQIKDFYRWGAACMFTLQFTVNAAIESTQGFTMAILPYKSISKIWINGSTDFYIGANSKDIIRNSNNVLIGEYILSGFYLTSDAE